MRMLLWLLPLIAVLSPRSGTAQDSTAVPTLNIGAMARYRLTGDTSWSEGRIVGIGSCMGIGPLQPDAGGFFVVSMSAVKNLEYRRAFADTTWVAVPERALGKLKECEP